MKSLPFLFFALTAMARQATAEETIAFDDGAALGLVQGKLELSVNGKKTWSFEITAAAKEGTGHLKNYKIDGSVFAVHAEVISEKGDKLEVVLVRQKNQNTLKKIWQDVTNLRGDIGERVGKAVRFSDLTGDGAVEIITGYVSESVRLCGQKDLPLLFRRVYDWKTGKFRQVLAKRLELEGAADISGYFAPLKDADAPSSRQINPVAASRTAGDKATPLLLSPPQGIADQKQETAWVVMPGNGAGEFATMDIASSAYGITRLAVLPVVGGASAFEYDRPKTLILATEKRVYRLIFPDDPASNRDQPVWFDLGAPERTSCLSLIIESSFAPSSKRPMAIAELMVLTEADGPNGLNKVAGDLNDPEKRRQAAMLLEQAGAGAVQPIAQVWEKLDSQGKQLAVSIIAEAAPKAGAELLAKALIAKDPALNETAKKGLIASGEIAVPYLKEILKSDVDSNFQIAVDILASIGGIDALKELISVAGTGSRERRYVLRTRLGLILRKPPLKDTGKLEMRLEILWNEVESSESKGDLERVLDLLSAATEIPELTDRVAFTASRLYEKSDEFENRYRFLEIMAKLGCDAPFNHLKNAAKDSDLHIRAVALKGLGSCNEKNLERRDLIRAALDDREPLVRLAALDVILSNGLASIANERLSMLAQGDDWPDIRAKSVASCRDLDTAAATQILVKAQNDPSYKVRAEAVRAAIPISGKAMDELIEARLKDSNEKSLTVKTAAFAAGIRCQESALVPLSELLKKGAEPLASDKDIAVAEAAAKAIGAIGTKEAVEILKEARKRSNPSTDKAIDVALKAAKGQCGK